MTQFVAAFRVSIQARSSSAPKEGAMEAGLILTLVLLGISSVTSPDAVKTLVRLRTTESAVQELIGDGQRRSPTFAALVDTIERSDTFVYVARVHRLPHAMEGCLVNDGDGSPVRYLRVLLAIGTPRERMIVVLAHEFQHVAEVLAAGIVNDRGAVDALFNRIGSRTLGSNTSEQYETVAAQRVMAAVDRELHSRVASGVKWRKE
jgi:hypothetical protein